MSDTYALLTSFVVTTWLCYFAAKLRLRIGVVSMHMECGIAMMRDVSLLLACASSAVGVGVLLFKIFTSIQ